MGNLITIKGLKKKYVSHNKTEVNALKGIDLGFEDKGLVCIVGRSGCGKTSFLNCLCGLDSFDDGQVSYDFGNNKLDLGKISAAELTEFRNLKTGMVFQDYCLIDQWTVEDNIRLALDIQKCSEEKSEIDERVTSALGFVGLEDVKKRYIKELSGGQQQRVAIARAIVKNPSVIMCDEPTGNLDLTCSNEIMALLKSYSKTALVIVVTHDIKMAEAFADRIIEMSDGMIVSDTVNEASEHAEKRPGGESDGTVKAGKLSFKRILHIAWANMCVKKVKLVLNILVLIIVMGTIKLCYNIVFNNVGKSVSALLQEEKSDFLYTYEEKNTVDKNGYKESVVVKNGSALKKSLVDKFGEDNCFRVLENVTMKAEDAMENCILVIDGKIGSKSSLKGKMPEEKDEIAISDYLSWLIWGDTDCIGKTVNVLGCDLKICGVIEMGVDRMLSEEDGETNVYSFEGGGRRAVVSALLAEHLKDNEMLCIPFSNPSPNMGNDEQKKHWIRISSEKKLNEAGAGPYDLESGEMVLYEDYARATFNSSDLFMVNQLIEFVNPDEFNEEKVFDNYLNLKEYLPEPKVKELTDVNIAEIILSDEDFSAIRDQYLDKYFFDSFEVCLNAKSRKNDKAYKKLTDENVKLELPMVETIYDQRDIIHQTRRIYYIAAIVMMLLCMLLLIIFFSLNVRDNYRRIGILKGLGCTDGDVIKIWFTEAAILSVIVSVCSFLINLKILDYLNGRYMRIEHGLADYYFISFPVEALGFILLTLSAFILTAMPIWIIAGNKPVELIRKRL